MALLFLRLGEAPTALSPSSQIGIGVRSLRVLTKGFSKVEAA